MSIEEEFRRKYAQAEEFSAPTPGSTGYRTASGDIMGADIVSVNDMLTKMVDMGASDLFLSAGSAPLVAVNGSLVPLPGFDTMDGESIKSSVYDILDGPKRKTFEETFELDTSHHIAGVSRFRLNVFISMGNVSAVFRAIPEKILTLKDLKMPDSLNSFCDLPRGLVLVTGPTGSGKSTTLAAMIDEINRTKQGHILTIEDPIEFVHSNKECLVNQREVGTDTLSFSNALKSALREAPNYVLVGELRDLETISLAISIAETGHLVLGTLHTQSSKDTISRIVDVFPGTQQEQIRTQLAATLQGIICQNLVKTADGKGRVAALEVLKINDSIKTKIRKNQLDGIVSDLQTGSQFGMRTMDQHLEELVRSRTIGVDEALNKAYRRSDLVESFGGEEAVNRMRKMTLSSPMGSPMGSGFGGMRRGFNG